MEINFKFLNKDYKLLGIENDGIVARMKYKNTYQPFEINLCVIFSWIECDDRNIAVDCGVFIGDTLIPLAHYFDKVYGFDPNPLVQKSVKYAIINNKVGRKIKFYDYGIVDKSRINKSYEISDNEKLNDKIKHHGKAKLVAAKNSKIKLSTLDDIIPEEEHDKIRLIKIDVEGQERFVFDGSMKIIEKSLPTIIFEYEGKGAENSNLIETLENLVSLGYTHLIRSIPVNYIIMTTPDYLSLLATILKHENSIGKHLLQNMSSFASPLFLKEELEIINKNFHLFELNDDAFYYYVDTF